MSGRWDGPELTGQIDPSRSLSLRGANGSCCPFSAIYSSLRAGTWPFLPLAVAGRGPGDRGRARVGGLAVISTIGLPSSHSMTSSAWPSNNCGTVRPSALAVLRLITSSNLVGRITGRSAGFSPLRIRPT